MHHHYRPGVKQDKEDIFVAGSMEVLGQRQGCEICKSVSSNEVVNAEQLRGACPRKVEGRGQRENLNWN